MRRRGFGGIVGRVLLAAAEPARLLGFGRGRGGDFMLLLRDLGFGNGVGLLMIVHCLLFWISQPKIATVKILHNSSTGKTLQRVIHPFTRYDVISTLRTCKH